MATASKAYHPLTKANDINQFAAGDQLSSDEDDDAALDDALPVLPSSTLSLSNSSSLMRREDLIALIKTSRLSCIICLRGVKNVHSVWSCIQCYEIFHLQCIQEWAQRNAADDVDKYLSDATFPNRLRNWCCPKCRHSYEQSETPTVYKCFCGQQLNPKPDPWLLAHSCGETCSKTLQPACGHFCSLKCHPGNCITCLARVESSCYCGRQKNRLVACNDKQFSCGAACSRKLSCGKHSCQLSCHSLDQPCAPCTVMKSIKCCCGRSPAKLMPCETTEWKCSLPCTGKFDCGLHKCMRGCHVGICGPCPDAVNNCCPCGKTTYDDETFSCTEKPPTCGDTCDKLLTCDLHKCIKKCHYGPCSACAVTVQRRCRCGAKSKQLPCSSPVWTCDAKCKRLRTCENHKCNRTCCTGGGSGCAQCTEICSRKLNCGEHKCSAPCHTGPCYPCNVTATLTCDCGRTKVEVPCGRRDRRRARAIVCRFACTKPNTTCHHDRTQEHRCHSGPCPPCKRICELPYDKISSTKKCEHSCQAICHDSVPVLDRTVQAAKRTAATPWALGQMTGQTGADLVQQKIEHISLPCPPCKQFVPVPCAGQHKLQPQICSEKCFDLSCGGKCGQPLACGKHQCDRFCHVIDAILPDCGECGRKCSETCPNGHKCSNSLQSCHAGQCPPCREILKKSCYCGAMRALQFSCDSFQRAGTKMRAKMLSCGTPCTSAMACGHPCGKICHPPQNDTKDDEEAGHLLSSQCMKKKTIACQCKAMKRQVPCNSVVAELPCDLTGNCALISSQEAPSEKAVGVTSSPVIDRNEAKSSDLDKLLTRRKKVDNRSGRRRGSESESDEDSGINWAAHYKSTARVFRRHGATIAVVAFGVGIFVYALIKFIG